MNLWSFRSKTIAVILILEIQYRNIQYQSIYLFKNKDNCTLRKSWSKKTEKEINKINSIENHRIDAAIVCSVALK